MAESGSRWERWTRWKCAAPSSLRSMNCFFFPCARHGGGCERVVSRSAQESRLLGRRERRTMSRRAQILVARAAPLHNLFWARVCFVPRRLPLRRHSQSINHLLTILRQCHLSLTHAVYGARLARLPSIAPSLSNSQSKCPPPSLPTTRDPPAQCTHPPTDRPTECDVLPAPFPHVLASAPLALPAFLSLALPAA